jgi:hypothetical protein
MSFQRTYFPELSTRGSILILQNRLQKIQKQLANDEQQSLHDHLSIKDLLDDQTLSSTSMEDLESQYNDLANSLKTLENGTVLYNSLTDSTRTALVSNEQDGGLISVKNLAVNTSTSGVTHPQIACVCVNSDGTNLPETTFVQFYNKDSTTSTGMRMYIFQDAITIKAPGDTSSYGYALNLTNCLQSSPYSPQTILI